MRDDQAQVSGWRTKVSGLGFRLSTMVLLALVPLGLAALTQTYLAQQNAAQVQQAASVGRTLQEALAELRIIRAAQVTLNIFATRVSSDPEDCQRLAETAWESDPRIARAAYVDLRGQVVCSSDGSRADLSQEPRFAQIIEQFVPSIFTDPAFSPPGQPGISLTAPVTGENGDISGFVLLSLPEEELLSARPSEQERRNMAGSQGSPLVLIAANRQAEMVYSSIGLEAVHDFLPPDSAQSLLTPLSTQSVTAVSASGTELLYTSIPAGRDLHLLGVWPAHRAGDQLFAWLLPYLFPALTWLVGVVATVYGVEHLVTRHIRRLSSAMRDFAGGDRMYPEITLIRPPAEIASLANTYGMLTATILRDGAELENLLRKNASLLREVHHRTGNSLQQIASFLRMHRRATEDEGVRAVLDDLHNRVMSLSSVHLGLYRVAGASGIAVDQLMSEVIAKVDLMQGWPHKRNVIAKDLQPLVLSAEQAVPLALLLAEILSCFPPTESPQPPLQITLASPPAAAGKQQHVTLAVSGPIASRGKLTGENFGAPAAIGARLIRGFVTQLHGTMAIEDTPPRVLIRITFPMAEATDPRLTAELIPTAGKGYLHQESQGTLQ